MKRAEGSFETLSRHEVPKEFREEHVLMGFRPVNRPLTYYLCTMFTMHNEVVNVWTHIIPFGLMLRVFLMIVKEDQELTKQNLSKDDQDSTSVGTGTTTESPNRTFYLFMCTVLAYLLVSALAHLMHSASKSVHYLAFYCDFATIAFYSFLSAVAFYVYSATPAFFARFNWCYVYVAWTLALSIPYACCFAKFKFTRPYPPEKKLYILGTIGTLYLWNIYPVVDRIANGDLQDNTYHYLHLAAFLSAVFFYSSGWPQKSFPGLCDHFFHGHQIFHVLIAITTYYQVLAIRYDMKNYVNDDSNSDKAKGSGNQRTDCWSEVSSLFAIHALFSLLVIRHFYKKIQKVLAEQKMQ